MIPIRFPIKKVDTPTNKQMKHLDTGSLEPLIIKFFNWNYQPCFGEMWICLHFDESEVVWNVFKFVKIDLNLRLLSIFF